jgi:hypothetical protein
MSGSFAGLHTQQSCDPLVEADRHANVIVDAVLLAHLMVTLHGNGRDRNDPEQRPRLGWHIARRPGLRPPRGPGAVDSMIR